MFQSVFEAQSGNRSVIQTYYVEAGCVQSVSEAQSVQHEVPYEYIVSRPKVSNQPLYALHEIL